MKLYFESKNRLLAIDTDTETYSTNPDIITARNHTYIAASDEDIARILDEMRFCCWNYSDTFTAPPDDDLYLPF